MGERLPLWRSDAGVTWSMEDVGDGENYAIHSAQDVWAILEYNQAQFTHNDGWNNDRTMKRCASIPVGLRYKWLVEEGWDAWNPDHDDMLKRKLNDPDFRKLRTAGGRV